MRAVQAIFMKQLVDLPKNLSITIMYIIFPLLAFLFANFLGGPDEYGFDIAPAFIVQFATMFAAMVPMVTIANTIAEDNEYKSLRFLVTAGVKPGQYLTGLIGFVLVIAIVPLLIFAFIGSFAGMELVIFLGLSLLGVLASAVLGAIIGLFSKNVQQCSAIYTPIMMILGFAPFIAMYSEAAANIAHFTFTFQIFAALTQIMVHVPEGLEPMFDIPMTESAIIIAANVVIFAVLFVVAYRKKGLRG
ncbi:MAG: ABC transporter permease [Defluviitaleaceae bacterium]|nr:ABC transporter permease [Defluviitaleaceae bacterium]